MPSSKRNAGRAGHTGRTPGITRPYPVNLCRRAGFGSPSAPELLEAEDHVDGLWFGLLGGVDEHLVAAHALDIGLFVQVLNEALDWQQAIVGRGAVVHRDDIVPRLQLLDDALGVDAVERVDPADWHHQNVHLADLFNLILAELVAEVAEVDDLQRSGGDDADTVLAAREA